MENEEDLKNYILLHKQEYELLVKAKTKAEQYRNLLIDSNNNQMTRALTTIEGKNLYQLIKEREDK